LTPVQELTGGTPTANLLTGLGVDEYFTRTDAGGVRNYFTDALGSTLALTDSSGSVQTQYTYEPYGAMSTTGSSTGNTLSYTGREADGTGLFFYRARYYDPRLQRFIAEDPLGFGAGDSNMYVYVGNSPISYFDPLGMTAMGGRNCSDEPDCFAQLKYRQVDDETAEQFGGTHSFWYVQDSSGAQFIISAGPIKNVGRLGMWVRGGNVADPQYVDNVSATVWWDSGLSPDNCAGVDAMVAAARKFPQGIVPYVPPTGPNSNSASRELGGIGGFIPPMPPGGAGWHTPIRPWWVK
jgi:RHS repeat-associated protein